MSTPALRWRRSSLGNLSFRHRALPAGPSSHAGSLLALAVILVAWALVARDMNPYLLPSPARVAAALGATVYSGQIWGNALATLLRITWGFVLGVGIAGALCVLSVASTSIRRVVADACSILNATSVFVWVTLAIVWFGLSDAGPVFVTCLTVVPVMLATLMQGIEAVPRDLTDLAQVEAVPLLPRVRHVLLPDVLPFVVAGMQVSFALGLRIAVVSEIFGASAGVGYQMNLARNLLHTDGVIAWALILIGIMLVVDNAVFGTLRRYVESWR